MTTATKKIHRKNNKISKTKAIIANDKVMYTANN